MDLFATFKYVSDQNYPLSYHLKDEETGKEKDERYEGKSPEAGFVIDGIPRKGHFAFDVNIHIADGYAHKDGEKLHQEMSIAPQVAVKEL